MNRIKNIKSFAKLNRDGYSIKNPKKHLICNEKDEEIYIIYPGKETQDWNKWDFRPSLIKKNQILKNLEFSEAWYFLDKFIKEECEGSKSSVKDLLKIFYKMIYFDIHDNSTDFYILTIDKLEKSEKKLLEKNIKCIDEDSNPMEISLKSFLIYNDLIASNEDCKYFYKEYTKNAITKDKKISKVTKFLNKAGEKTIIRTIKNKEITYKDKSGKIILDKTSEKLEQSFIALGKIPDEIFDFKDYENLTKRVLWINDVGRVNTLKTYMNVLYHMYNDDTPYNMLQDCMRKKGVFEITVDKELIYFLNNK